MREFQHLFQTQGKVNLENEAVWVRSASWARQGSVPQMTQGSLKFWNHADGPLHHDPEIFAVVIQVVVSKAVVPAVVVAAAAVADEVVGSSKNQQRVILVVLQGIVTNERKN